MPFALPGDCASQIRKKLFHGAESDLARHSDTKATSTICGRAGARRLPGAGQKRCCRHSTELGFRRVTTPVILPRKKTARHCVCGTRPEALRLGIEIAVIFVQLASYTEC